MAAPTDLARWAAKKATRSGLRLPGVTPGLQWFSRHGLLRRSIWRRLPVPSPVTVTMPDGARFRFAGVEKDERGYFWGGADWREGTTAHVFVALAREARTVVDVGANAGLYSLMALATSPSVRLLAYEPAPATHTLLCENLRANGFASRCVVRERAASDSAGVAQFHVPDRIEWAVMASLDPDGFRGIDGEVISVVTERVDDALDELDLAHTVDLVKIDVEHFEHLVLRGMERTLTRARPPVVFEAHPDGPYEVVGTILRDHDYVLYGCLPFGLRPVAAIPEAFGNLLALPAGRRPPVLAAHRRRRGLG